MPLDTQAVFSLLIAALGGAAIGMERQWSGHASGPASHFAGIRTFTLLGLFAGLAGLFWVNGLQWFAGILLAGAVGLILIGYYAASKVDHDGTTEMAALVVLAAGVLAALGNGRTASALFAGTALLLVEKSRLHSLVERIPAPGLKAAARFAAMALIVLPLLPEGPFGPWGGVRPRELWILVLFFSSLSFGGYIARGLAGSGRGYVLTGLLGGLISSTNVTWTFSRLSRRDPASAAPLAIGVVGACTIMYFRVFTALLVLEHAMATDLFWYLAAPAALGVAMVGLGLHRGAAAGAMLRQSRGGRQRRDVLAGRLAGHLSRGAGGLPAPPVPQRTAVRRGAPAPGQGRDDQRGRPRLDPAREDRPVRAHRPAGRLVGRLGRDAAGSGVLRVEHRRARRHGRCGQARGDRAGGAG